MGMACSLRRNSGRSGTAPGLRRGDDSSSGRRSTEAIAATRSVARLESPTCGAVAATAAAPRRCGGEDDGGQQ